MREAQRLTELVGHEFDGSDRGGPEDDDRVAAGLLRPVLGEPNGTSDHPGAQSDTPRKYLQITPHRSGLLGRRLRGALPAGSDRAVIDFEEFAPVRDLNAAAGCSAQEKLSLFEALWEQLLPVDDGAEL